MATIGGRKSIANIANPTVKKTSYLIGAFSDQFADRYLSDLEKYFSTFDRTLKFLRAKDKKDLLKSLNRNIEALIIDVDFGGLDYTIKVANSLKNKKQNSRSPVFFITQSPDLLMKEYQKISIGQEEIDKVIHLSNIGSSKIISELRSVFEEQTETVQERRSTTRFKFEKKIKIFQMGVPEYLPGLIYDISMHSALIESNSQVFFKHGEQLQIEIPFFNKSTMDNDYEEFLKLSARVLRVHLSGKRSVITWEHLNDRQLPLLSELLLSLK